MTTRHMLMALVPALFAALFFGCSGEISDINTPPQTGPLTGPNPLPPPAADAGPTPSYDQSAPTLPPDAGQLPGPGEVCPNAECTADSICIGGLCHRMCTMSAECNVASASAGCAPGFICLPASSFTDACYEATAELGQVCGPDAEGRLCQKGMLCVSASKTAKARCMTLCQASACGGGAQCAKTTSGCEVCVPR